MTRVSNLKGALAGAFGAAAETYHSAADVQREVASRLARRIAALTLAPRPRVLEIGCGTGFLYQALAPDLKDASWLLTDLSEAMVRRARSGPAGNPTGNPAGNKARFTVMDGERPPFAAGGFDLICASLVFQWFEDLPGTLSKLTDLLAPGGALAFTTLTAESFPEWREAHHELGARAAVRGYPTVRELARMIPKSAYVDLEAEAVARSYRNAHAFLAHWKEIGTHVPDAGRPPLTPGTMRKLLRKFDRGITVTYHVAYGTTIKV
ncbi:MAG: methyltransferase domain-containing protein [Rhodospirillaceae bacterium]